MTFKDLRKKKYRTAQELAEKIGVSSARVAKWETGASAPNVRALGKIAKALGVSVTTLVKSFEE